jgi:hypothetical protein
MAAEASNVPIPYLFTDANRPVSFGLEAHPQTEFLATFLTVMARRALDRLFVFLGSVAHTAGTVSRS